MPTTMDVSLPFNGQTALEDSWRDMFSSWLRDGVMAGLDNELLVYGDSTGRQVKVATGRCRLVGVHGKSTSIKTIALAANTSGNPRIDRIVARSVLTGSEHIELDVLQGTPGVTPVAPALTQTSSVWEVSLARVQLANGYTTVPAQAVFPTASVVGAPVDERALIGSYGCPTFADTVARDLWVPAPLAGFQAATRDKGGLYVYDGAAWKQTRRESFHLAYQPSVNEDSGSNTIWPFGLHTAVTVPKWATRCYLRAKLGQIIPVTSTTANVDVRLLLDTLVADDDRITWTVSGANHQDIILEGDVDCTAIAGTSVVAETFANNLSGTTVLRADAFSSCFIRGEFR